MKKEDKSFGVRSRVTDVDREVWERLPFWVRELIRMLERNFETVKT